jgi:hypothetical protein
MKKLLLGAAASAALFAGAANASLPVGVTALNTYNLYSSGASASRPYYEKYILGASQSPAQRLCMPAPAPVTYVNTAKDQHAYLCKANIPVNGGANTVLATAMAGKTYLMVHKRSAGGSGYGVGPIAVDAAMTFLDPAAACTLGTTGCNVTKLAPSDFGLSDAEPGRFTAAYPFNVPVGVPGLPLTAAANLTVLPVARQVFGVVVNTAFRNALQTAQGKVAGSLALADMPTLTLTQATNLIRTGTAASVAGSLLPTLPLAANLHACGRTDGSGTKAVTAIKVCTAAGAPDCQGGTPTTSASTGRYHEMGSASGVNECLSELNSGLNTLGTSFTMSGTAKWAIGYQSTDNNALPPATALGTLGQYQFVKLGGVEPTLVKAAAGIYVDVYRSTCQYNKTAAAVAHLPVAKKALITQICQGIGSVAVINGVNPLVAKHSFGQAGFLP